MGISLGDTLLAPVQHPQRSLHALLEHLLPGMRTSTHVQPGLCSNDREVACSRKKNPGPHHRPFAAGGMLIGGLLEAGSRLPAQEPRDPREGRAEDPQGSRAWGSRGFPGPLQGSGASKAQKVLGVQSPRPPKGSPEGPGLRGHPLGLSWALLWPSWGYLGGLLGLSWAPWVPSGPLLKPSWDPLGLLGAILSHVGLS